MYVNEGVLKRLFFNQFYNYVNYFFILDIFYHTDFFKDQRPTCGEDHVCPDIIINLKASINSIFSLNGRGYEMLVRIEVNFWFGNNLGCNAQSRVLYDPVRVKGVRNKELSDD